MGFAGEGSIQTIYTSCGCIIVRHRCRYHKLSSACASTVGCFSLIKYYALMLTDVGALMSVMYAFNHAPGSCL